MFAGGICLERERLLRAANAAVSVHCKSVTQISKLISEPGRKPTKEELSSFDAEILESFLKAHAAWDEYRKHVQEHGC